MLAVFITLSSCTKTNDTPEAPEVKPEWRIKRIFTETNEIKLTHFTDTMSFEYDTAGRFSQIKYRLFGFQDHPYNIPDYTTYVGSDYTIEYDGPGERVHKMFFKNMYSADPLMRTYTYDNGGKRLIQIANTDVAGNPGTIFKFNYKNSNNPSGYVAVQYYPTANDTTVTDFTFTNGHITKKVNTRHAGGNVNTFTFERNAAGNPTYNLVLGKYTSTPADTMRKIYFTWKPYTSPALNKVKKLPALYEELIEEWGSFYFPTQNQLTEFDYFDIISNGEMLDSYNFTWNMYTIMANQMSFTYFLDPNGLIGRITGAVAGKPGTMEMRIEYEKIQ